ncbi:Lsr2 family DNA-binding protein [Streptomyces wuyuanensis]|uniref:Lsr2 family DNA-binding protein n=1 Tax=Streptomyces wuyuanensis TaxID=1196353 RepID=UPI003D7290B4
MSIRWDTVEADLGMPLPRDYRELAERYGPGRFCDYLSVFHPHGVTEFVSLTGPVPGRIRAHLCKDHDEGTFPVPYDPDQLFAIGATDNGEYLFWITTPADPDTWRVAVNEARGPRWFTYDGNLTAFLATVLSGQTQVPQFPDDLLDDPCGFTRSHPTLWKPEPPTSHGPVDTAAIRAWARAHGYDVPSRGRIPPEILEARKQANQTWHGCDRTSSDHVAGPPTTCRQGAHRSTSNHLPT